MTWKVLLIALLVAIVLALLVAILATVTLDMSPASGRSVTSSRPTTLDSEG